MMQYIYTYILTVTNENVFIFKQSELAKYAHIYERFGEAEKYLFQVSEHIHTTCGGIASQFR